MPEGIVGGEFQGAFIQGNGLVEPPEHGVESAQADQGFVIIGCPLQCLFIQPGGLLPVFFLFVGPRHVDIQRGVLRGILEGPFPEVAGGLWIPEIDRRQPQLKVAFA